MLDSHKETVDMLVRARSLVESLLAERRFDRAVDFLEASMTELTAKPDASSQVFWLLAARAYFGKTDTANALRMARKAEAEFTKLGETTELSQVYLTLGGILREMGQLDQAERAFRDAESISRRADDFIGRGEALNKLARLAFMRADYPQSVSLLTEAIDLARREENTKKLAYLYGNLGRVQTLMGMSQDAVRNLTTNVELSTSLGDYVESAKARLSLGYELMRLERYDEAQMQLERAADIIDRHSMPRENVIYLTYLGELQTRRSQYALANETLQEATRLAERISATGDLLARAKLMQAELALAEGNYRVTLRMAADAEELFVKLGEKVDLGVVASIVAQALAVSDREGEAVNRFEESLQLLEDSRAQYELARALEAAGRISAFSMHRRLSFLFRAQEVHMRRGDTVSRNRIEQYVHSSPDFAITPAVNGAQIPMPAIRGASFAHSADTSELIVNNPQMRKIVSQLSLLAKSDLPILFTGETGVGKGALAKRYHQIARPNGPFVAFNVMNVPETLLESELFGHARGAYTDAVENTLGLLGAANGGTLFLDEIGEMPLALQMRLLTVIEEKRFRPLGSVKEVAVDFVLVTATNRDLKKMVEEGHFRRDLYHRLDGFTFDIPPLRERKDEIPLLLASAMRRHGLLKQDETPEPELVRKFVGHSWPGNIRELENMVKRMDAMSSLVREGSLVELVRGDFEVKQLVESNSLFHRVVQFERELILDALVAALWNKSRAARELGIHESTLRAKMKRFMIDEPNGQPPKRNIA